MNASKGVVRNRELAKCDPKEIKEEMSDQCVTDAVVIKVKRDGVEHRTNTVILSFSTSTPPKYVMVGYERVSVNAYIPNPLRCFNCQRYGHGQKNCKNRKVCACCSESDHSAENCILEEKCFHCHGKHMVSSKECPRWQAEKRVQQLKAERNISFPEARQIVFQARPQTVATVVKSSVVPTKKPSSRCIQTQTDLTWPLDLAAPVPFAGCSRETQTSTPADSQTDRSGKRQRSGSGSSDSKSQPSASASPDDPNNKTKPKTAPPRLHRPPKKLLTSDPVQMYNKYGVLDVGDDNSVR